MSRGRAWAAGLLLLLLLGQPLSTVYGAGEQEAASSSSQEEEEEGLSREGKTLLILGLTIAGVGGMWLSLYKRGK